MPWQVDLIFYFFITFLWLAFFVDRQIFQFYILSPKWPTYRWIMLHILIFQLSMFLRIRMKKTHF